VVGRSGRQGSPGEEGGRQRLPGARHARAGPECGHGGRAREVVEAAAQVAQEGMRPAEHPRPDERFEPAQRAQSPFQVLVVALDALLDPLPPSRAREAGGQRPALQDRRRRSQSSPHPGVLSS
jgi:hypothetical protein